MRVCIMYKYNDEGVDGYSRLCKWTLASLEGLFLVSQIKRNVSLRDVPKCPLG